MLLKIQNAHFTDICMITRLSKKRIEKGKYLVQSFGYWSTEVRDYLDQFEYTTKNKLDNLIRNEKRTC